MTSTLISSSNNAVGKGLVAALCGVFICAGCGEESKEEDPRDKPQVARVAETVEGRELSTGHHTEEPHEPRARTGSEVSDVPRSEPTSELRIVSLSELPESHPRPNDAPDAVAVIPPNLTDDYTLVVFLHGWNGCVNVLARSGPTRCAEERGAEEPGWGLGEALVSGTRVILFAQLAFRARESSPGGFSRDTFIDEWLTSALEAAELKQPTRVVVAAHSAGYETALEWARSPQNVVAVVLFDALYGATRPFFRWAAEDRSRQLVSYAREQGETARQQRLMGQLVARDRLDNVSLHHTRAPHRDVPAEEGGRAFDLLEGSWRASQSLL